jgi:hypothetical protein
MGGGHPGATATAEGSGLSLRKLPLGRRVRGGVLGFRIRFRGARRWREGDGEGDDCSAHAVIQHGAPRSCLILVCLLGV